MPAEQYPFAQELITDVSGQIRKVILDFSDYKRLLEVIEEAGLYRAMMEVKNETSLDEDTALPCPAIREIKLSVGFGKIFLNK